MKDDPLVKIYEKIIRVIHSCDTQDQLDNANKYLKLAEKNGYIPEEMGVALYYNVFLTKAEQFN